MKKTLITAAALAALAATAVGAVHATMPDAMVCVPPAVIHAVS